MRPLPAERRGVTRSVRLLDCYVSNAHHAPRSPDFHPRVPFVENGQRHFSFGDNRLVGRTEAEGLGKGGQHCPRSTDAVELRVPPKVSGKPVIYSEKCTKATPPHGGPIGVETTFES